MSIPALQLKGLMAQNGIVSARIAEKLGLDNSTVCKVVTGYGRSERVETAIADALNMNRDDIFPVIPKFVSAA